MALRSCAAADLSCCVAALLPLTNFSSETMR